MLFETPWRPLSFQLNRLNGKKDRLGIGGVIYECCPGRSHYNIRLPLGAQTVLKLQKPLPRVIGELLGPADVSPHPISQVCSGYV